MVDCELSRGVFSPLSRNDNSFAVLIKEKHRRSVLPHSSLHFTEAFALIYILILFKQFRLTYVHRMQYY